jgi:hypothetical protein
MSVEDDMSTRTSSRTMYVKAGTKVLRLPRKSRPGKGMSYGRARGTLREGARIGPQAGWDVVDVNVSPRDKWNSAYSFDLRLVPRTAKRKRRKTTHRSTR